MDAKQTSAITNLLVQSGLVSAYGERPALAGFLRTPQADYLRVFVAGEWFIAKVYRGEAKSEVLDTEAQVLEDVGSLGQDAAAAYIAASDAEAGIMVRGPFPREPLTLSEMLRSGKEQECLAAAVGTHLARLHGATGDRPAPPFSTHTRARYRKERLYASLQTSARRHPDLATTIEAVTRESWDLQFSLVNGSDAETMLMVIGERPEWLNLALVHFGDPAMDVSAFMGRLLLQACVAPEGAAGWVAAVDVAWRRYVEAVGPDFGDSGMPHGSLEARVCRQVGVMMLAAVDGSDPVIEPTRAEAERVRLVGRALSLRMLGRVEGVLTRALSILQTQRSA